LYWQVAALPNDRQEIDTTLVLIDAGGKLVTQDKQRFGAPPLEWTIGDVIVEWYAREIPAHATQFSIEMTRGASVWRSPLVPLR
jgi:hypothetical protein